jgi:hypothetical protein
VAKDIDGRLVKDEPVAPEPDRRRTAWERVCNENFLPDPRWVGVKHLWEGFKRWLRSWTQ